MANKTPPFPEYEAWTTARYWQFIRSNLRKAWTKWPPKFDKMKEGRVAEAGKRHKFENSCEGCKKMFQLKDLTIDHETPAGALNCEEDAGGFISRLFVGTDKLNRLCRPCHQAKTNKERKNGV